MVLIICVLNHKRISWVSIEIYHHDNFVFGHILMFLTSISCSFLYFVCSTGRQKARSLLGVEPWYVVHMLVYALALDTTICRTAYSICLGTRRITEIGLKIMG